MAVDIRWSCAFAVLLATTVFGDRVRAEAAEGSAPRRMVLVELFTSEGCSSCPPADAVLSELVLRQPLAGVEVLALGEHVDYWDRLGWRDRFSSADHTTRQSDYDAHVFHRHEVYTPQLVIDRQLERVGSDIRAVQRAIKVGSLSPAERTSSMNASVPVASELKTANLKIVSFLQERPSRRIVGAGAASAHPRVDTR